MPVLYRWNFQEFITIDKRQEEITGLNKGLGAMAEIDEMIKGTKRNYKELTGLRGKQRRL